MDLDLDMEEFFEAMAGHIMALGTDDFEDKDFGGEKIGDHLMRLQVLNLKGEQCLQVFGGDSLELAQQLVLACGAYVDQLDRRLQSHILPVGTYVIATEPLGAERARALLPAGCAVSDNQFILDYFRLSADHRLLFGGKCTYTGREPANLAQSMRADMVRVFPQLANVRVEYAWGGHIDITRARTPDFGQCGRVYWAQGFSGHGVVPTCVAARVLSEAILGDDSHLRLFMQLQNPAFPGGETLSGLLQVLGMSYYRLRDYF